MNNTLGQVTISDSRVEINKFRDSQIAHEGMSVEAYLRVLTDYTIEIPETSFLEDTRFINLTGESSSAISIYDSALVIRASAQKQNETHF